MNIKSKNCDETLKLFLNEANMHKKLEHPNILKFLNAEIHDSKFYMILEYCKYGSLHDLIKKQNSVTFSKIKFFFKKICLGLEYLHSKKIIHRDLKLENILLSKNKEPKISDFGWASSLKKINKRTTFCGTYEYMAPEVFESEKYDFSVDIWSLGILLYEMYHKKTPFYGSTAFIIYKNIISGNLNFREDIDQNTKDLILGILKVKPENRLNLKEILEHDFFKEESYLKNEENFEDEEFDSFLDRLNYEQYNHFEKTKRISGNLEKENSFIEFDDEDSIKKSPKKVNKKVNKKKKLSKKKKLKKKKHQFNISFDIKNKKICSSDEKIFGIKTDRKKCKLKDNGFTKDLLKITEKKINNKKKKKSKTKLSKTNTKKNLVKLKKNIKQQNPIFKKKLFTNSFFDLEENYLSNFKSNQKNSNKKKYSRRNSKNKFKNKTMLNKNNYPSTKNFDFKFNISSLSNRDIKVGIYDKPFKKKLSNNNNIWTKLKMRKRL